MTNDVNKNDAALSLLALRRIDDCTARFEAAWNAGQNPAIEDYLAEAADPERPALFRELLLSELELRKARPAPENEALYLTRFPQYQAIIRAAFAEAEPGGGTVREDLSFLQPSSKPGALGRLGHFEVLEVIGKGGFGVVLRAFDEILQRVVAVKVMSPQLSTTSPPRKRFLREARSAGGIHHDNVVQIYAVEEQPIPYLVMEYIQGETLQQRLDRTGPLELAEILRIGQLTANGLAAAHDQLLIHRDIKPANILLESGVGQRVKVSDFGLARTVDDASLTQSGLIAGTPMYMAPEQAQGEAIDCRADLFSLGSVLYVMSTGRPPFRAPTTVAVLKRVVEDTPRPIREIIPELPQWLADLIARLHAKTPAERFQTAQEVADLLGRCLMELQAHGHVREGKKLDPLGAPPKRPLEPTELVSPRPSGRWRLWLKVLGVVCLLAVAVLGLAEATGVTEILGGVVRLWFPAEVTSVLDQKTAPPLAKAPFDAVQARAHQQAWAKFLAVKPLTTNSIGMQLALIPPGEMRPSRFVGGHFSSSVAKPFYAGICEVSVGQFRQFVQETGYRTDAEKGFPGGFHFAVPHGPALRRLENVWSHADFVGGEDWPVSMVTWHDARAFCDWLSKKEGRGYRLPTESEWFWCTRAGSSTRYYFGDDPATLNEHAWHLEDSGHRAHPVGGKKSNPWGLFDVYGNVNELCFDWYRNGKELERVTTAQFPAGPGPNDAIPVRGLSFHDPSNSAVNVGQVPPSWASSHIGFRVILTEVTPTTAPPVVKQALPPGRVATIPYHQLGFPNRVVILPGSQTAVFSNSVRCLVWDLKTNQLLRKFDRHGIYVHVWGLAVSADGQQVLTGDAQGKICLWNPATGQELHTYVNPTGEIWGLLFLPDKQSFLTLDSFGNVRLWDLASGKSKLCMNVPVKDEKQSYTLAFARDGSRILLGQVDGFLRLVEVPTGKLLRLWKGHAKWVTSAALAPDGRYALTGGEDGTLHLWDLKTEGEATPLGGHGGSIWTVAFTPDGRRAVSGGEDKAVRVWNLADRKEIECFRGHTAGIHQIALTSDGKYALSMVDSKRELAILWRLPGNPG